MIFLVKNMFVYMAWLPWKPEIWTIFLLPKVPRGIIFTMIYNMTEFILILKLLFLKELKQSNLLKNTKN